MRTSRESKKQLPLIDPALIVPEADCASKADAIRQAVALLQQAGRIDQRELLIGFARLAHKYGGLVGVALVWRMIAGRMGPGVFS